MCSLDRVIGKDVVLEVRAQPLDAIKADSTQVEQVLMNLCINARDAMPKGGRLLIETGMVEVDSSYSRFYPGVAAGRYAVLSVSDTVVGTADFCMSTASRGKEVCFAYTSRPCRGSG